MSSAASGDAGDTLRMRRAADSHGSGAAADHDAGETAVEPLDEEDQERVIRQFEQEIEGQFTTLWRAAVAVCTAWEAAVLSLAAQPVHLCRLVNRGTFSDHKPRFDACPGHTGLLVRSMGLSLAASHACAIAFLLRGGRDPPLLRLGFYSLGLPLGLIAYCVVGDDGGAAAAAAAVRAAAAQGDGPAVGVFEDMGSLDMPLLWGALLALLVVSLLLLFLARSVFSCRADLRAQLQALAAKRYSFKSL